MRKHAAMSRGLTGLPYGIKLLFVLLQTTTALPLFFTGQTFIINVFAIICRIKAV